MATEGILLKRENPNRFNQGGQGFAFAHGDVTGQIVHVCRDEDPNRFILHQGRGRLSAKGTGGDGESLVSAGAIGGRGQNLLDQAILSGENHGSQTLADIVLQGSSHEASANQHPGACTHQ
jgi:hypothetical protein